MDWEAIGAIGNAGLAVGAVTTGTWAVYSYRSKRREDAARWMRELYNDFYTDPSLLRYRRYLEYEDLADELAPVLLLRVADRDLPLRSDEHELIEGVDRVLNFLEQLLYLEEHGHVKQADLDVFFQYWFEKLGEPFNASLCQYLAFCGYERCATTAGVDKVSHIVAAGPDEAAAWAPGELVSAGGGWVLLRQVEAAAGYDPTLRDAQALRRRIRPVDESGRRVWAWVFEGSA